MPAAGARRITTRRAGAGCWPLLVRSHAAVDSVGCDGETSPARTTAGLALGRLCVPSRCSSTKDCVFCQSSSDGVPRPRPMARSTKGGVWATCAQGLAEISFSRHETRRNLRE